MVVGEGVRLAALGILLGAIGAVGAARALRTLVYGVGTSDLVLYAAAVLFVVAIVACAAPARRAARVDPLVALRGE